MKINKDIAKTDFQIQTSNRKPEERVSYDLTVSIIVSRQWMNYSQVNYGPLSPWGRIKLQTISIPGITVIK